MIARVKLNLFFQICLLITFVSFENSSALGEDVQAIGENLASKRDAKLVRATERLTDGVLYYMFEFAIKDGTHQFLSLCVSKGKIWSVDANTTEKRLDKRGDLLSNVIGSFAPKLA